MVIGTLLLHHGKTEDRKKPPYNTIFDEYDADPLPSDIIMKLLGCGQAQSLRIRRGQRKLPPWLKTILVMLARKELSFAEAQEKIASANSRILIITTI